MSASIWQPRLLACAVLAVIGFGALAALYYWVALPVIETLL
ncbi:MAG: hypothetical protein ACR2PI_01930 [Hyphomicrobiaceae bacterium]